MNTCLNCGKMKPSAVMQGCTCQYSMQALPAAQPEQEPVAWMTKDGEIYKHECWPEYEARPLVFGDTSSPPQRPWVDLTDEEIQAIAKQARSKDHAVTLTNKFLKEKNT